MPKASKYPKLRVYVKRGKAGQVWTSYAYDNRGSGKKDIPLGSDRTIALQQWAEIHFDAPRIAGTLEEAFRAWEVRGIERRADGTERGRETVAGYLRCLKELRPVFGPARWDEVTMPVLAAYVQARSAKARAKQEMQLLAVIWSWARLDGLTALPWPAADMGNSGWSGKKKARQVEVSDEAFNALHRHADQTLRDALDIATATGLRVHDVLGLRLSDIQGGRLIVRAQKTGKRAEFDLSASRVLPPIIDRRQAMQHVEHDYILAAGRKAVGYRALFDRFADARAKAAKEVPECAGLFLRDMRKRAAQIAGTTAAASQLLQHSSEAITRMSYKPADKVTPAR